VFRAPRGQMPGGATQAMSWYIVEERQRSRCPRAAGTRRAHGGCGRSRRCSSSTMYTDIASSSRLELASQAPCARPVLILGRAPSRELAASVHLGNEQGIRDPRNIRAMLIAHVVVNCRGDVAVMSCSCRGIRGKHHRI
jgi:hypothetical protein